MKMLSALVLSLYVSLSPFLDAGKAVSRYTTLAPRSFFARMSGVIQNNESFSAKNTSSTTTHPEKPDSFVQRIGCIAHDLKNPLIIIQGLASDISDASLTAQIIRQVSRCLSLVNRFIAISKRQNVEKAPCFIKHIIEQVLFDTEPTMRQHSVQMTFSCGAEAAAKAVLVDENSLKEAFANIVVNACHALQPKAQHERILSIDIALQSAQQQDEDEKVVISITDSGIGMSRETKAHLFEPFYTTKKGSQGTGLGMVGAYNTVIDHGGSISVQSEENRGTTVAVVLPVSSMPVPAVQEQPELSRSYTIVDTQKRVIRTLLIVDDEEGIRRCMSRLFTHYSDKNGSSPLTILTAQNQTEAIEKVRVGVSTGVPVDAVILDKHLKGNETGMGIAVMFRLMRFEGPIIIASGDTTAYGGDEEVETLMRDNIINGAFSKIMDKQAIIKLLHFFQEVSLEVCDQTILKRYQKKFCYQIFIEQELSEFHIIILRGIKHTVANLTMSLYGFVLLEIEPFSLTEKSPDMVNVFHKIETMIQILRNQPQNSSAAFLQATVRYIKKIVDEVCPLLKNVTFKNNPSDSALVHDLANRLLSVFENTALLINEDRKTLQQIDISKSLTVIIRFLLEIKETQDHFLWSEDGVLRIAAGDRYNPPVVVNEQSFLFVVYSVVMMGHKIRDITVDYNQNEGSFAIRFSGDFSEDPERMLLCTHMLASFPGKWKLYKEGDTLVMLTSPQQKHTFDFRLESEIQKIFEQAAYGIVLCNKEGKVVYSNRLFLDMLAISKEEIVTYTLKKIQQYAAALHGVWCEIADLGSGFLLKIYKQEAQEGLSSYKSPENAGESYTRTLEMSA